MRPGRDPVRTAKARALAGAVRGGFYRGELRLTGDAYEHLRGLGLSRAEVHRAACDLVADRRAMISNVGATVVVRLVVETR